MKPMFPAVLTAAFLTVTVTVPLSAQEKSDRKLEKRIEKLTEELSEKMTEMAEKLGDLLDDTQKESNRDLEARQKNLQKRTERLQDRLRELESEEDSEGKQDELEALKEELNSAESELEALQDEAKANADALEDAQEMSRYINDKTVEEGEVIPNKLMVINGNLTVYGTIEGDAIAVKGDVILKSTAVINGDATSVGGRVIREDGAKVTGTINEVKSDTETMEGRPKGRPGKQRGVYPQIDPEKQYKNLDKRWTNGRSIDFDNWWWDEESVQLTYNRVDGLYFGLQKEKNYYWNDNRKFSVHGYLGYGFGNSSFQYKGAFDRWINDDYRTEIGVEGYDFTEPKDDWKMTQAENSVMGLVAREDFLDWYRVKGVGFHLSQYFTPDARITAEYQTRTYSSLENSVQWSVFGGDKRFRLNPAIQDGEIRSMIFTGELDKVSDFGMNRKGVYLKASGELAGGGLKGDYSYNRILADLRGYTSFSEYDNLGAHLMVGSGDGNLPLQKIFELGGPGSLDGYRTNEFAGNRMVLLKLENLIHSEDLQDELPSPIDDLNLLLFTEVGYVNGVKPGEKMWEGFDIRTNSLKNSIGFGFASEDEDFRFTLGWRTDKGGDPVQLMVRFRKPF
ncbi:MAG: DUF5686 family protein [Bacteroidetes bacterium]|nr:DUF5686 family protein [Bacteroidota bacterium]